MKNLLALLGITAFASCNTSTPTTTETTETKTEMVTATPPANTPETLCFRNEVVFKDNPDMKDVTELQLAMTGDKVTGTYNWLPAEKDQRNGTLTGTRTDNTIQATYTFMQEGTESTVPVQISLTGNEATVTGGNAALGLNATLAKADCK